MRKKYKILIAAIVTLIVLSAGAYLLRGWIRGSVISSYASHVYKGKVVSAFDESFSPINQELKAYGITFNNHQYQYEASCYPSYEGFSESVYCYQGGASDQSTFPASFNDKWTQDSPKLEKQLLSTGWKPASHQPITSLLRGNEETYYNSLATTYIKQYGKTYCTLQFSAYGAKPAQFTVFEDCARDIAFFHGEQQ